MRSGSARAAFGNANGQAKLCALCHSISPSGPLRPILLHMACRSLWHSASVGLQRPPAALVEPPRVSQLQLSARRALDRFDGSASSCAWCSPLDARALCQPAARGSGRGGVSCAKLE
uniref:Uncharacterized protein n=1 Tax=Haptolina ericina TaxID=156174 RepID=A0A7S3C1L5_9EUKA